MCSLEHRAQRVDRLERQLRSIALAVRLAPRAELHQSGADVRHELDARQPKHLVLGIGHWVRHQQLCLVYVHAGPTVLRSIFMRASPSMFCLMHAHASASVLSHVIFLRCSYTATVGAVQVLNGPTDLDRMSVVISDSLQPTASGSTNNLCAGKESLNAVCHIAGHAVAGLCTVSEQTMWPAVNEYFERGSVNQYSCKAEGRYVFISQQRIRTPFQLCYVAVYLTGDTSCLELRVLADCVWTANA